MSVEFYQNILTGYGEIKTNEDIEGMNKFLSEVDGMGVGIQGSKAHYFSGYDSLMRRPKKFIGPLKCNLLPDSLERRLMLYAGLYFFINHDSAGYNAFIPKIPGVKVVRKILKLECIFFSKNRAAKKDCFDETFKDDLYYLRKVQIEETYGKMRFRAFETTNPLLLLNKMGYKEVGEGSVGDVIVYFSNIDVTQESCLHPDKSKPSHYGRIVEVKDDNTLIVESRWNDHGGIFHHRIDCVPLVIGTSYLIYTKK